MRRVLAALMLALPVLLGSGATASAAPKPDRGTCQKHTSKKNCTPAPYDVVLRPLTVAPGESDQVVLTPCREGYLVGSTIGNFEPVQQQPGDIVTENGATSLLTSDDRRTVTLTVTISPNAAQPYTAIVEITCEPAGAPA